jgi:hypothetical protein
VHRIRNPVLEFKTKDDVNRFLDVKKEPFEWHQSLPSLQEIYTSQ